MQTILVFCDYNFAWTPLAVVEYDKALQKEILYDIWDSHRNQAENFR